MGGTSAHSPLLPLARLPTYHGAPPFGPPHGERGPWGSGAAEGPHGRGAWGSGAAEGPHGRDAWGSGAAEGPHGRGAWGSGAAEGPHGRVDRGWGFPPRRAVRAIPYPSWQPPQSLPGARYDR